MSHIRRATGWTIPRNWPFDFDTSVLREAATGFQGQEFKVEDIGKLARQNDDGSYWTLEGISPTVWVYAYGAGGGGGGGGAASYFRAVANTTTDVNTATPTVVPWDGAVLKSTDFTHDAGGLNPERITFTEGGTYAVHVNLNYEQVVAVTRGVVRITLAINGTPLTDVGYGQGGYSRASNPNASMSNFSTIVQVVADDYLEVFGEEDNDAGVLTLIADASVISIARIASTSVTPGAPGTPGGTDTEVQYNDGGTFGGDARFLWNKAAGRQTVVGDIVQVRGTAAQPYDPTVLSTTAVGTNARYSKSFGAFQHVVDSDSGQLDTYDITNPLLPRLVGTLAGLGGCRGCDATDSHVFVTDSNGNLHSVNVKDKANPTLEDTLVIGNVPRGCKLSGSKCLVTSSSATGSFKVVDVIYPDAMRLLGQYDAGQTLRTEFEVDGDLTYVVSGSTSSNFQILDFSDPTNIVALTSIDIGSGIWCIAVQAPYAYIGTEFGIGRVDVFDVSDPSNVSVTPVGTIALNGGGTASPRVVRPNGDVCYVVDAFNNAFQAIDIADPLNPFLFSNQFLVGQNPVSLEIVGTLAIITDNTDDNFVILDIGGIRAQGLKAGSVDVGNIFGRGGATLAGRLNAKGAVLGDGGMMSGGEIATPAAIIAGRGLRRGTTSTAASISTSGEAKIVVTDTSAPRTITLRDKEADVVDYELLVKDGSGGAATNNISLVPESRTIDGLTQLDITTDYGRVWLFADGTNWFTM